MPKEPNWNEINYRKESSMAWLNAMNNAATIVASKKYETNDELIKDLEVLRDKIYKLNMTKIDHDAAGDFDASDLA